MVRSVPITNLRKNIFDYARLVSEEGYEIEVEKNGKKIFKLTKIERGPKEAAKRALKIARKLGGIWKNVDSEFFRGKKEKIYMKKLGSW